ncbi:VOC family protein [Kribbella sp. NBC_00709]|uniref:VOC family protein n=1 Tax=Kribbella sp. NBC_00709 TaxID=2975972 RepID=UPI002E2DC6E9|nr:VOC family protein [Kribbella sp. NBC_00709]
MTADANILHHVGLITRDLDATIAQYEQLGFSFTPLTLPRIPMKPGGEPELLGAGNRTAIFADNYLEVLAVVDEARWAAVTPQQRGPFDLDRSLARYEGLHVMHFGTDDIEALYERITADGVPNGGIHPYQRTVDTEDGPQPMRARAMGFPPEANPEALVQIAQHLTPELIFQKRYQHHDNGATGVNEITVCGDNPERYAALYTLYTGHGYHRDGDVFTVDLGRSSVRVVSPEALATLIPGAKAPAVPSLVGFTTTVTDLAATRTLLTDRGIPFDTAEDTIHVPATHGAGSVVSFTTA